MKASPVDAHSGEHVALGLAVEQAVLVLDAHEARGARRPRPRAASRSWAAVKFEQPISRTLPWRTSSSRAASVSAMGVVGVGGVELVEVDVVGPEAAQAVLEGPVDVVGLGARALGVDRHAELRGQDDVVAARPRGPGRGTPRSACLRRCRRCRRR